MAEVYDEIRRPVRNRETGAILNPIPEVKFPDACPLCGAAMTIERDNEFGVGYACGGSYKPKDQIQNHTDVWWGKCGAAR